MSLFSWNCERCGTLLDNMTVLHRCTNAPRSTTEPDWGDGGDYDGPEDCPDLPTTLGVQASSGETKPSSCPIEPVKEKT